MGDHAHIWVDIPDPGGFVGQECMDCGVNRDWATANPRCLSRQPNTRTIVCGLPPAHAGDHEVEKGGVLHIWPEPPRRTTDPVNSPDHYRWLPIETIEITEHFSFTLGNVLKYVMRADHKGKPLEDLKKARWYLDREIARREAEARDN